MSLSRTRLFVRRVLAVWTGVLIILVVTESRAIPPVVLAVFLPYLALVAFYTLARQGTAETDRSPIAEDLVASQPLDIDLEMETQAPSAILEARSDLPEESETSLNSVTEQRLSTTAPVRTRRRVEPKTVPEPSLASWVQVGPGRFVRGEEPQPSPSSSMGIEPTAHSPETPPDLDDDPYDKPLADDASTARLAVSDPDGVSVVPVMAPAASQPESASVHFHDDEDHVPMVEAVLADSAWMPESSSSSVVRPGVANASPGSHEVD